jgi:hypothetical protein
VLSQIFGAKPRQPLDDAVSICKMHIENGRESHEQRGTEGQCRGAGTGTAGGRGAAEELAGTGDPALAQGVELVRVGSRL